MTGLASGLRVRTDEGRPAIQPVASVVVTLGPDFRAVDAATRDRAAGGPVAPLLLDTTTWGTA